MLCECRHVVLVVVRLKKETLYSSEGRAPMMSFAVLDWCINRAHHIASTYAYQRRKREREKMFIDAHSLGTYADPFSFAGR